MRIRDTWALRENRGNDRNVAALHSRRQTLILATGVLEILLAAALLIPRLRRAAGIGCLCVLVAFFPANVYAAFNQTGLGGHTWGPEYLLVRAPLQLVLLAWTYGFAVR